MSAPLVSIIMNCLNSARDLQAALDSVAAQTFPDWEIIFWDNGSTDDSAAIAKGFGPGLRYFYNAETAPLGRARNLAIKEARGEYIAFLDCDDLWKPEKLAKQVAVFSAGPQTGLVCTDTEIWNGGRPLSRMFQNAAPERGMVFDALMSRQWISMSSAMLRKKALDSLLRPGEGACWFDENLQVCEEADVFYRLAHDWEVDFVDEPLTIWRVHGENSTFKKFAQFARETRHILAKHRLLYPDYDSRHAASVAMLEKRADFQEAVALWREGSGVAARKLVAPHKNSSPKLKLFWLASFLPGNFFDLAAKIYFGLPKKWRR